MNQIYLYELLDWLFIAFDNKNNSDDNYHYFFLNYEKSSVESYFSLNFIFKVYQKLWT